MYQDRPELEDAYWDGYRAYQANLGIRENPYRQDEDEEELFEAWQNGWSAASWDD